MNTVASLRALAERAVPFLRDEGAKYDDDGSNEPLELAREIEAALATPEQPGSAVQGEVYVEARECSNCEHIGINDSHATDAACHDCEWSGPSPVEDKCPGCGNTGCMTAACPDCGSRYRLAASLDITTPPPAPAAEQGDALALLREIRATGVGLNDHWLARVDAVLASVPQPEARGVEGMILVEKDLLREAADSAEASTVEDGISDLRREYRNGLATRLRAVLAAPNPVRAEQPCTCPQHPDDVIPCPRHRAEQPEGKWKLPDAKPDLDPVTLHERGESASEWQQGFNEGWNEYRAAMLATPAAPGAGVGVDEAIVTRILDWQPVTCANRGTRLWQLLEDAGLPHDKQIAALTAALAGKDGAK